MPGMPIGRYTVINTAAIGFFSENIQHGPLTDWTSSEWDFLISCGTEMKTQGTVITIHSFVHFLPLFIYIHPSIQSSISYHMSQGVQGEDKVEEEPQIAYPLSMTWVSHIATTVLTGR